MALEVCAGQAACRAGRAGARRPAGQAGPGPGLEIGLCKQPALGSEAHRPGFKGNCTRNLVIK